MRKIRLVKTNQSPTGLAAVLEAGGTWGQVPLHLLSVFRIYRYIGVSEHFSCHSTCFTLGIIIQSDPVQSSPMFTALTPTKRYIILFIRLHKSKSRIKDVQIYQCSANKATASHIFPSVQRSTRFTLCTAGPTSHQSTSIQLSSWPVQKCGGKWDSRSY